MKRPLATLITHYTVPVTDRTGRDPGGYREEAISTLMTSFFKKYPSGLVLYGGQTATEKMLGFHKMRSLTNDIDFICTERGIKAILEHERVEYNSAFDVLFMFPENIPVSFAFHHIHDWVVTDDFFVQKKTVSLNGVRGCMCNAEYSIMLKFRRAYHCANQGRNMFGKDALDIINMIVAPFYAKRSRIDYVKLAELLKKHVCPEGERLFEILKFIIHYKQHLPHQYRGTFDDEYKKIVDIVLA